MVKLDIRRINQSSPYNVEYIERNNCYKIVTDYGVMYSVSLEEDVILKCATVYVLNVVNVNNKKSPNDRKLRDTILSIIYEFFSTSTVALLYICETGDSRQLMRSRLFSLWFHSSPYQLDYTSVSASIVDEEGHENRAVIIMRIDNPYAGIITSEFLETARLLREK